MSLTYGSTSRLSLFSMQPLEHRTMLVVNAPGELLVIRGSDQNDVITISPGKQAGEVIVTGASGIDDGTLVAGLGRLRVLAGGGDDVVTVRSGLKHVTGAVYMQVTLNGGAGDDLLVGAGVTNTTFNGGSGSDSIIGRGIDTLRFTDAVHGINVHLRRKLVTDDGTGSRDEVQGITHVIGSRFDDTITGGRVSAGHTLEFLHGGKGDDLITAGDVSTGLGGGAGNDTMIGSDRADGFDGGSGADSIVGNGGRDTLNTRGGTRGVIVRLDKGIARDGFGHRDTLSGIEEIIGSAYDDLLVGDDHSNVIRGAGGRDTIIAKGGNDVVFANYGQSSSSSVLGGSGDDEIYLNLDQDPNLIDGGDGTDTLTFGSGKRARVEIE